MNFGPKPNQGPPQIPLQEKEEKKKFIEEVFKKLEKEKESNLIEIVCIFAQKIIGAKIQYEVLEKYTKDPEGAKKLYEIGGKNEARGQGVNINVKNVLEKIWTPGNFVIDDVNYTREFQMLSGDEMGILNDAIVFGQIEKEYVKQLRSKIDYIEKDGIVNSRNKENDFLNDINYREIVREYLSEIIKAAEQVSEKLLKPNELDKSSKSILLGEKEDYSENEKEYLKALKELCSMYFEEMK